MAMAVICPFPIGLSSLPVPIRGNAIAEKRQGGLLNVRCGFELPLAMTAIAAAVLDRLRAVILTSLATIPGPYPILFAGSDDAPFAAPFAVSMLGGPAAPTAVTLSALAAIPMIVEGRGDW